MMSAVPEDASTLLGVMGGVIGLLVSAVIVPMMRTILRQNTHAVGLLAQSVKSQTQTLAVLKQSVDGEQEIHEQLARHDASIIHHLEELQSAQKEMTELLRRMLESRHS